MTWFLVGVVLWMAVIVGVRWLMTRGMFDDL